MDDRRRRTPSPFDAHFDKPLKSGVFSIMARDGAPTQLYLVLTLSDAETSAATALPAIQSAARTGRLATVLVAPNPLNPAPPPVIAHVVSAIQELGIAALVPDAALARVVKADGVHLAASKSIIADYREARETLSGRLITGADAGRSRHDAMTLGEEGADYIGFGIPPHVEDRETARQRRQDLVAWWTEIFEVPCVAFDVATPGEAEDLVGAGADFIAVHLPNDLPPDAAAAFLAPYLAALDLDVTAHAN